ncbi:MAG: arginine repressor [Firmicutes bacterium]|nr:arginine repressor [Bacillota bacterium]
MRYARHNKIIEIINSQEIDTQEKLADKLSEAGFKATQATVSRDIRELGLIKKAGKSGRSCYAQPPAESRKEQDRLSKILRETVLDIRTAENIIVIRTLSGCANAAAEVIDNISPACVVGTLAGDNTIFVAVDSKDNVESVLRTFEEAVSSEGR